MLFKLEAYVDVDFEKGTSVDKIAEMRGFLQKSFENDYVRFESLRSTILFLNIKEEVLKFEFLTKEDVLERMRTNGKT